MADNASQRGKTETVAPAPSRRVVLKAKPETNGRRSSDVLLAMIRGFWLILLGMILGAGLASLVSQLVPPVYQAETQLLVVSTSDRPPLDPTTQITYAQTFSELATSPEVMGEVVSETGIVDPHRLQEVVTTEVSTSSPVFAIVASDRDPDNAAELANALGAAIEDRNNLARDTGFRANVIGKAVPAEEPAWPNLTLNLAIGAGIGALLGVIAALIWNDRRRA
jgi:succinoglycan biosynthesis transport protein ExoP